ncbi:recombinase family protein [Quadrisphaera sp. DSM 44207]|uniref:recombinase family protein n=1 Tax=Quadrisphaera sp. DSM 44207 TaxID=1881057 RepID=UPI00088144FE|nr:recombinase family protein [Quadrisphaera sp. DSM 44207]SDQ51491.1 Site-specific DNA recombinase [Quadrisphaera sp. DSM 44207]
MATPTGRPTGRLSGHLLGYARASTAEQNLDLQTDELAAAGCWRTWSECASGSLQHRPALEQVLEALRPGDTLVVWRLDRLGRSLRHLIEVVTELEARGVGFRSLRESIDTTTPGGRLVFHLFGALAQFEREVIRDRTLAGLAAARARGRTGGRPAKLTGAQRAVARRLYEEREHTVAEIGALLGVSRSTVYRSLGRDSAGTAAPAPSRAAPVDGARPVRSGGRRARW